MIKNITFDKLRDEFYCSEPFNHVVIDNFFEDDIAEKLSEEFPDYDSDVVNRYKNALEDKRTLNRWDKFPPTTYRVFHFFGTDFVINMRLLLNEPNLIFDFGLNGGGWHMHSRGGNNNVHLDYNIHPKLDLQRKLNIIVYLTKDWNTEWGGGLELWTHDEDTKNPIKKPKEKVKTIDNLFNRAIIFDTTQNSWHGLPNQIDCPEGVIRKSIAGYYMQPQPKNVEQRGRAFFAARSDQIGDTEVEELIRKRADICLSNSVYVSKSKNNH